MKRKVKELKGMFFILFFMLGINSLFAAHQEFQQIKDILDVEKQELPETVTVPNVAYQAEGLRNPFEGNLRKETGGVTELRPGEKHVQLPEFSIQGIVWGSATPQAIVNNRVVKIGDTIEGARILEIGKEGITVLFNEQKYFLSSPGSITIQSLEESLKGGQDEEQF